ncbi:MAG: hypothetical protein ABI317_11365 [Gaiellales bacterium]
MPSEPNNSGSFNTAAAPMIGVANKNANLGADHLPPPRQACQRRE